MTGPDEDWRAGGFGLYLHWPYCQSKCPYCDFNSHVAASMDHGRWAKAYVQEIERLGRETEGRVLQTLYFGGGTPSLMAPDTVAEVIAAAQRTWGFANSIEITLEANPGSVEAGRFRDFRAAGVNRVSLGVQALNDRDLQRLGRAHDVATARAALALAQDIFERTSFDLIYARQDQTLDAWKDELSTALSFGADHMSLYQLTIEDGTVFGRRFAAGQLTGLPGEDLAADMYLVTQAMCEDAGLAAYEVSNHARSGQESRHNMIYWQGGDYIGIGPGAHGRLTINGTRQATFCPKTPTDWLRRVERIGSGEDAREVLNGEERAEEYLLMGLRLSTGISLPRFAAMRGRPLSIPHLTQLAELGLVQLEGDQLMATRQGRMVLNRLLAAILDEPAAA